MIHKLAFLPRISTGPEGIAPRSQDEAPLGLLDQNKAHAPEGSSMVDFDT